MNFCVILYLDSQTGKESICTSGLSADFKKRADENQSVAFGMCNRPNYVQTVGLNIAPELDHQTADDKKKKKQTRFQPMLQLTREG